MFDWDLKLQTILEQEKIAGMSVAVTDREKIIYARGFGVESVERPGVAPDEKSLYRIASITKLMTGITLMRLVEEGKLSLDRPVKDYIPWLHLRSQEAQEQMTLRHLMSHTSGLPVEYTPNGPREESALEQTLMDELAAAEFATLPADGVHLYSNLGIRLASCMAQRVTGRMFTELCQDYALTPLGMNSTTFDLRKAATYPICKPHVDGEDGSLQVYHYIKENAARMAAGGLYSNTEDLCKLARYLLNGRTDAGETILRPESLEEMFRIHAMTSPIVQSHYGLTMCIRPFKGRVLRGHTGSAPPYATVLFTEPQSGYGIVALLNTQRDKMRIGITELLFGDLLRD